MEHMVYVEETTLKRLQDKVNEYLEKGYVPISQLVYVNSWYIQPMIRAEFVKELS